MACKVEVSPRMAGPDERPMMSRSFEFLRPRRAARADLVGSAERHAHRDPSNSLLEQRTFVEKIVTAIYERRHLCPSLSDNLDDLMNAVERDPVAANDLPDAHARWRKRKAKKDRDRTARRFVVSVKGIEDRAFDLSINCYKDGTHEAVEHEPPKVILARPRPLDAEIAKDLDDLESMS